MENTTRRKVLVIDDEAPLLEVIQVNLEAEGYEVLTAPNGEIGLASAVLDEPDVILLDIMMPDIDGWEVCRRLRMDTRTKYIPVIMLTALGETRNVVRGLESGADDYLCKPFHNDELCARIKSVLNRAGRGLALDPLTRLPGKHQAYEETRKRMERRNRRFAFLYIDISNLRFINYAYGISRGDSIIRSVSEILSDVVLEEKEFLGHIGEDDFVVLTVPGRVEKIFRSLVTRFDEDLGRICPELLDDLAAAGDMEVKLSMAVVTNEHRQFGDPLQVRNVALEVLKNARKHPGHWCSNLNDHPL